MRRQPFPNRLATLAGRLHRDPRRAMGTRPASPSHPGSGCRLRPGGQDNQPISVDAMRDFFALFEAARSGRPIR